MFGSLLVLEALRDNQILSTVIDPLDSTCSRAHALLNRPCCALVAAHR
jgi:hypothetical protein